MGARLGQHFLIDASVRDTIVAASGIGAGSRALEIGPGRGILTEALAAAGAEVLAVEKDERLAAALEGKALPGVKVVTGDFLYFDLNRLEGEHVVVANLPYAVASPILQKLLAWRGWKTAVLMFQKEVAERIAASPGSRDWGLLTLSVLIEAEPELVAEAPPSAFSPRPKVSSAVIRLRRREKPLVEGPAREAFFRVAKAAFSQRRKMTANPIAAALSLPRSKVEAALEACGVGKAARAEALGLEAYLRLPRELGLS